MFYDKASIYVKAGDGGRGLVSFRRERLIGRGGPDGGDGGKGGDVKFKVDPNLNTLSYFRRVKHLVAPSGKPGGKNKKRGKSGEDLVVYVPAGTMVFDETTGELIADLVTSGEEFIAAFGGRGGFGNAHFATSRRQAPTFSELGEPGEEKKLRLELKLVADVGIIGLPNVGKSTLLSVISRAKPKIASYPFTTLIPNLGVVEVDDFSFVACDIPGLIEGASKGKGLGDEFLRHIERCRILVHLIDITSKNPLDDFEIINKELKLYSKKLLKKSQILAFNKIDAITADSKKSAITKLTKLFKASNSKLKIPDILFISAVTREGLPKLLYKIAEKLKKTPKRLPPKSLPVLRPHEELLENFTIRKEKDLFVVSGKKLQKVISQLDIKNQESFLRLLKILERIGVFKELKKQGIKKGDKYKIGRILLRWS